MVKSRKGDVMKTWFNLERTVVKSRKDDVMKITRRQWIEKIRKSHSGPVAP